MEPAARLLSFPRYGSSVGLHRMVELIRRLPDGGRWLAGQDTIRVTGSNGKGSVATMTAAILQHLGLRVGLYTSPHLASFGERMRIDGVPVPDTAVATAADWLEEQAAAFSAENPHDKLGAFEATTLAALYLFSEQRPQVLVAEAGIGGRYDSTRALPGRAVALTSLDAEHTALLGESPELIAYDKADLCPDGGILVAGELNDEIRRRLRGYCEVRGIRMVHGGRVCRVAAATATARGTVADLEVEGLRLEEIEIATPGAHQLGNACLAIVLVMEWLRSHQPELARPRLVSAVREALATIELPGRFDRLLQEPPLFVDIGHTPRATAAVAATARQQIDNRPLVLVLGVSQDRTPAPLLAPLLPLAEQVFCTRSLHRGMPARQVAAAIHGRRPGLKVETQEPVGRALKSALAAAERIGGAVLVAGGLFVAAEAMAVVEGRPPEELHFL